MFGKGKAAEKAQAPAPMPMPQLQRPSVATPAARSESPEAVSCISSSMTIVGKFVGDGVVKVFGRMEGELQASTVVIADGAQVEGSIVAQEVTIGGRVKGTIRANRVTLTSTAFVEGDIFHRSLAIEENARFEGSSRREDNVVDTPPRVEIKTLSPQPAAPPQVVLIDGTRKFNGAPDNKELSQSAE